MRSFPILWAPVAGVPHEEGPFSSKGDSAGGIVATHFLGNGDATDGALMALEGSYHPMALQRPHDDLFIMCVSRANTRRGGGGEGNRERTKEGCHPDVSRNATRTHPVYIEIE